MPSGSSDIGSDSFIDDLSAKVRRDKTSKLHSAKAARELIDIGSGPMRWELSPWRQNPKVHNRVHKSPFPNLSQLNPFHTLPPANLAKI
jgi:hypothetical protein